MTARRKTAVRRLLARLALLPLPERCFVVLLLLCALGPALLRAYAELQPGDASGLAAAGRQPVALIAAAAVALAALLLLEPPRAASLRAYAAQLRARLSQAQSHYDAELRRREPEEEHRHEDRPEARR